jgi:anthranilate synthase component 1
VSEVDIDDAAYADVVRRLKKHVELGDVFQIVPSRRFSAPCPDPFAAYGELRDLNPSPYMFYIRSSDHTLFGASPETAVRVRGEPREVTIRPIAGTAPRGRGPAGALDLDHDARLEAALRTDAKELAEHMMLVDLARNDVARVSKPGTRRVSRMLSVDRYSHVMHLVSEVTGALAPDLDALHAYAASLNMGTLVGAPKIRAAQLLRGVEPGRRGPYGGAVGYLTGEGEMDTAIVIRAAYVRDGVAHVRAGAGIVMASDPVREAQETRHKAASVLRAIARTNERLLAEAVP